MDFNNASALDIYRNRHNMEAKEYCDELRKAVYRDVKDSGKCQLIERLIVNPYRNTNPLNLLAKVNIPVLTFCAINDARKALENNTRFPELGSGIVTRNGSYGWNFFNKHGADCMPLYLTMADMQEWTELYNRLCPPPSAAPADYTPADYTPAASGRAAAYVAGNAQRDDNQSTEKPNAKAEKIIKKAEQEAKRREEEADAHYNRVVNAANRQRDNILSNANGDAAQIRRVADDYAAQTRREAKADADQIRLDAQNEAAELKRNAEAEARRIREEANRILEEAQQKAQEEAEQNVETLTQQKLSGYIRELRMQWEEEQKEKAGERADTAALAANLKEEVCTVSTTVGAKLNRDLEQLQDQLNQLRSNVTLDLQQWRSSLYKCEYGKLVIFYNTLNGYANVFDRELRAAECADNVPEEQKRILAEHSRKLNKLRANLISAMEPMGIRLFTPQKGELFNSYYHTIELEDDEDEDMFLDHEILSCQRPGIERVVNDRESTVLLRASVEVRKD